MVKDLVCGMDVPEDKSIKLTHEGKDCYFCSPACQMAFQKDPKQFVKE